MYLLKYFMYCTTATRMKLGMYFISYEDELRLVGMYFKPIAFHVLYNS